MRVKIPAWKEKYLNETKIYELNHNISEMPVEDDAFMIKNNELSYAIKGKKTVN